MINKAQVQRIDGIVKDSVAAGAKLEAGGTFDGPFYKPTVLTGVKPGMLRSCAEAPARIALPSIG